MNRFVIVINNRQASSVALGPKVGNVQKMIKTIDRTPKRVVYPNLRHALMEAKDLEADLKNSPGATVTLPDKTTVPLSQWIAQANAAVDGGQLPPEIQLVELGAADAEDVVIEEVVVDPDAPPAPAPAPPAPKPAAPAAPKPTPTPEPKQDAQAK
jgi:hypothetical protein